MSISVLAMTEIPHCWLAEFINFNLFKTDSVNTFLPVVIKKTKHWSEAQF